MESVKQSSIVLAKRGHSVEIACLDSPGKPWIRDFPVRVHAFGHGRNGYGYSAEFTRWIREHRSNYDAVIVHGVWRYNSFGVWRALHGTGTPYFIFLHGMLDPWFKRRYPLKHLKKLLYWPWAEYRVLRDASAVLFTSEEEKLLARQCFSLYRCNEKVVNYGTAFPNVNLDHAKRDFCNEFPELRDKRLLLFLGRLHEKKGCDLLIEALAATRKSPGEMPSFHLVMAGPSANPDYLEGLKLLVGKNNLERFVTFTGMLQGNLKWGAFNSADAFILPSHQENFGISVVEALACGTPVLISNKINIWREIVNDGAGFAEEDNLAGTTNLIERWRQAKPEDRAVMRTNTRQCFERRFEINRAVDSLLEVLQHPTE